MDVDALIGKVLGTCTLQRVIGQGEMGVVFLARQARPERQVAVKVLLPMFPLSSDQYTAFLKRFQHEIDAVASLKHPNVIQIYECGEYEGMTYLVMPYINGGTLHDEMEREGLFSLEKALSYLEQMAAALDVAHEHGVIHGNVQPANILLQQEGQLVLTDFGMVKVIYEGNLMGSFLTRANMPIETLDYMAPEQVIGNKIGVHADLYSLGVVLYQMLTGIVPFQSSMAAQHQYTQPYSARLVRPDLPIAAEQVILKALAARPAHRYMRAGNFANAFRQALLDARVILDPANIIPASIEPIATNSGKPSSSLELLARMVSQASTRSDKDSLDGVPQVSTPIPPVLNSNRNLSGSDVVKKNSFTLPSMSGFLEQPLSLSLTMPKSSPAGSEQEKNNPPPPMPVSLPDWAWPGEGSVGSSFASQPTVADVTIRPALVKRLEKPGVQPPIQKRTAFIRRKWVLPVVLILLLFVLLLSGVFAYVNSKAAIQGVNSLSARRGVQKAPAGGNTSGGAQSGPVKGNTNGALANNATAGTRNFQVGAYPLIVINGHGGNVNIQAGSMSIVVVTARQQGNINGTGVVYNQANDGQGHDRISIATNPGNRNVDYDITAPRATQVQVQVDGGSMAVNGISGVTIDTGGGNLDIEDIHGPVDVHTENGDITGNTLTGSMVLEVGNGGSIRLNNVHGSLKAVSHNGDVVVRGAALSGTSVMETNYGSVLFDGSIDPQGTYTLKTISGNVNLTLPDNAAFQLEATTGSGSVSNEFGSDVVGYEPRAQIMATITNGSVTINKAV